MSIISFGKFKGKDIEEIESSYLRWLLEQEWFEKDYEHLLDEIQEELDYRTQWSKHF